MKKYYAIVTILLLSNTLMAQHPLITSIISQVSIDSLVYKVEELTGMRGVTVNGVTDTIKSRHKLKPGNELAFKYMQQEFAQLGLQTDSFLFGAIGKNALAIQPGAVYPYQPYMICAHYDGMPNAVIAPAADDDASGVAAVLEAARVLSQYQFEHTIIYALWDEEEQGLVGSNAYALAADNGNDTIAGVIQMDAIAWDGNADNKARVHTKSTANSLAIKDTVLAVNMVYNIGLDMLVNNPGATYSDHASFWSRGYGAVLLIEDFDNDPNLHYHTIADSISYFNLLYYEKHAKLAIGSLAALAIPMGFTGLNDEDLSSPVILYPNPADASLTIDLGKSFTAVKMEIHDMKGVVVWSGEFSDIQTASIDIKTLAAGSYVLHVKNDQYNKAYSFLKGE